MGQTGFYGGLVVRAPEASTTRKPLVTVARVHAVLTALIVTLGLALRARGYLYDTLPLWLDEAAWSVSLIERPLLDHLIRPIGFMALTNALVLVFSASETALRSLPWLAGVVTTLLAPALAKRLYRAPAARLIFVAIIALHPALIDLSKEFKPYSISVLCHLLLMFLALGYASNGRSSSLTWALVASVLVQLFAQDVVFAYPGVFLVLAFAAWRERRRSHLFALGGVALLVIGLLGAQYVFIWSRLDSGESQYWANKYDIFLSEHSAKTYGEWWLDKYWTFAASPGMRAESWHASWLSQGETRELAWLTRWGWVALHLLGIGAMLYRRRVSNVLLLVVPLIFMTIFNRLGFWPFGIFRTNLFMIAYAAAIPANVFDGAAETRARWTGPIPAFLLVILPLLLFERHWNATKKSLAVTSYFPSALQRLARKPPLRNGSRELLLLDSGACDPYDYYANYNPTVSRTLAPKIRARFDVVCADEQALLPEMIVSALKQHDNVWLLAGKTTTIDRMSKRMSKYFRQRHRERAGTHTIFMFRRR